MRNSIAIFVFWVFLMFTYQSKAGVLLQLDYITGSQGLTSVSGTSASSSSYYNFDIAFDANSKKNIFLGWGVMSASTSENVAGAGAETFVSQDMGPYVRWEFGKGKMQSLALVYGIIGKANYGMGATSEAWTGTSYLIQYALEPEINENWNVGVSLNMYTGSFTKKVVSGVTSDVSYSKTMLFPMFGFAYRYQ